MVTSPVSVLQQGDVFLRVDGKQSNVLLPEDATALFKDADDQINVVVLRDGKRVKLTLTKAEYTVTNTETGEVTTNYGFGFSSYVGVKKLPFHLALGRSFSFMFFLVYKILAVLGSLVTGKMGMDSVGGPVTTISVMSEAASGGIAMLSYVICIVSANLAVMNLLPLPALDGSRMVFCLIEWIFKKPINRKVEGIIHTVGIILLFGFAIFADVFRYFIAK